MKFEVAPAAVIRAAAWPIETLGLFGAPGLPDAGRSSQSFGAAYDAALDRESASLRERTAGDPDFMKALLIASPSLFARVRREQAWPGRRTRSIRQLESSLYRYLARACARPTPGGLWAGVALAEFGDRERVTPATARADFTPDLAPFASALLALAGRAEYRDAARWRLGPTLRRQPDGTWRFLARASHGAIEVRQLGASAALDPFIERLGDAGAGTLGEFAARARVPREVVERLAEGGVLVGGLGLATRFASPWEALAIAGDALRSADRTAWNRASSLLADHAAGLSEEFDTLAVEDVLVRITRARSAVAELFALLGVNVPVPAAILRCDLRLPFDVTLGPATRRQLEDSLAAYQSEWIDRLSLPSKARRDHRRSLSEALGRMPLALGDPLPDVPPHAGSGLEEWAATFLGAAEEVRLVPAGPGSAASSAPWGCLLARLGATGIARVIGMDDSPIRPFARHSRLLGAGNAAERWVQELQARLEGEHGVKTGDLAIPFEPNPNALERPSAGRLAVEPWGAGGIDLRGAELRGKSGAIVLDVPSVGRVTVLACSAARMLAGDPLASAIAMSGFDEPSDPGVRATSLPAPGEEETPCHAPRLLLSSGASIRPRRTCLAGATLRELTRLPRRERYLRWSGLADSLDWPEYVSLSVDGGPSLVLQASSPLAVEAAFAGTRGARRIIVEEADTSGWLAGPHGHHVTEAVVPFSRSHHAFSALTNK